MTAHDEAALCEQGLHVCTSHSFTANSFLFQSLFEVFFLLNGVTCIWNDCTFCSGKHLWSHIVVINTGNLRDFSFFSNNHCHSLAQDRLYLIQLPDTLPVMLNELNVVSLQRCMFQSIGPLNALFRSLSLATHSHICHVGFAPFESLISLHTSFV